MIIEAVITILASLKKKEIYVEEYSKASGGEYTHID